MPNHKPFPTSFFIPILAAVLIALQVFALLNARVWTVQQAALPEGIFLAVTLLTGCVSAFAGSFQSFRYLFCYEMWGRNSCLALLGISTLVIIASAVLLFVILRRCRAKGCGSPTS